MLTINFFIDPSCHTIIVSLAVSQCCLLYMVTKLNWVRQSCYNVNLVDKKQHKQEHRYLIISLRLKSISTVEKDTRSFIVIFLLCVSPSHFSIIGEYIVESLGAGLQGSADWLRRVHSSSSLSWCFAVAVVYLQCVQHVPALSDTKKNYFSSNCACLKWCNCIVCPAEGGPSFNSY